MLLALVLNAYAGGLDVIEVGGSWGTPGATNPTAIWWNPAGLAVGGGTQFLIEGAPTTAKVTFDRTPPDYGDAVDVDGDGEVDPYDYGGTDTVSFTGLLPFVGVQSNFGVDGLGIGAGLAVPVARAGAEQDIPGPGSYHLRDGGITAIHGIVGASYQVADLISFGGSVQMVDSIWDAEVDAETLSTLQNAAGALADYPDQVIEDPNYKSTLNFDQLRDRVFTFGVGVYLTPVDQVGISLSYNHGYSLVHTGVTTVKTGCPPDTDTLGRVGVEALGLCNADVEGQGIIGYSLPSRIHAGVVLTPIDKIRAELMGGWVGWSVFTDYDITLKVSEDVLTEAADPASAAELVSQKRLWARDNQDTFFVGLDGKYQLNPIFLAGARVLIDRSAIPDRVVSTNNYDANSVNLSGLASFGPFGPLRVGLSAEHMFMATRTVENSAFSVTLDQANAKPDRYYYPSANGEYRGSITRFGLSISGVFGAE